MLEDTSGKYKFHINQLNMIVIVTTLCNQPYSTKKEVKVFMQIVHKVQRELSWNQQGYKCQMIQF